MYLVETLPDLAVPVEPVLVVRRVLQVSRPGSRQTPHSTRPTI